MEKTDDLESKNQPKKDKIDIKQKFINDFYKSSLVGRNKNTFIDEIMNNDSISNSSILQRELKSFKAYTDDPELSSFDEGKINIFDLKRAIGKDATKLFSTRNTYLTATFKKFDLNAKQKSTLEKKIKKINDSDLIQMVGSDLANGKFLDKTFGINKIGKIDNFKVFNSITEQDVKNRLSALSDSERKEVEYSLVNFKNAKLTDIDIRTLFSSNFLNDNEKKEIISNYIPYLSLQKAVDLGLLTTSEANTQKSKVLRPLLKTKGISGTQLDQSIESASLNDINVKSGDFFRDDKNLNIIAEGIGFSHIEDDFKSIVKEASKEKDANGPQSIADLKALLSGKEFDGDFEKISDFEQGNIIKVINKDKDGKDQIAYSIINHISDIDKTISLRPVGDNESGKEVINLSAQSSGKTYSFSQFIGNFEGQGKKAVFYTSKEINEQISEPTSNLEGSDLQQYSLKDLKDNPEVKEELQQKYTSYLEDNLESLESEKQGIQAQISTLEENQDEDNKKATKEQISALKIKESQLEQRIKDASDSLKNPNVSHNDLLKYNNKLELEKKLNAEDPEGREYGLKKGVFLTTKSGLYKITDIDWKKGEIWLTSRGKGGEQPENLTFENFYQSFKSNNAKRSKGFASLDDLVDENSENNKHKEIWSNYEVKNGQLHIKKVDSFSKDTSTKVDYLVSSGGDEVFKVEGISGDNITFKWGERKTINNLDEKEKKKYKSNIKLKDGKPDFKDGELQYEGELLSISNKSQTLNLNEFNKLLNKDKEEFYPDWQTGKNKTIHNPQEINEKFGGHFMTKLFNNFSISELMLGGKMMIEGIEEYLKKGNDVHAAKIASRFGKLLPAEIRSELLIKVERAEQESMDKEIESLGKVDSGIATLRIEKWLLNSDTPEPKKEAGMLFMLEKYGALTVKGALYKYRGKFLWYEAFGGRIGDELYLHVKAECEEGNVQFSEEKLMFILMNRQCKTKGGYNGIKRRSRLYKEFEGKAGGGITDEIEKGKKDGDQRRNYIARENGAFGETNSGGDANGLGFYKSAIERGAPLSDMNSYPFSILFSGLGYNMREEVSNNFKKIVGEYGGLIFTRFLSNTAEMDIFNDTILKLSSRYKAIDPIKYGSMEDEANKIFNNQRSTEIDPDKKLANAAKFWGTYGKALTRSLHFTNDQDDTHLDTDKILLLEEDSTPIFKRYNKTVAAMMADTKFENKDIMEDQLSKQGISGLSHKVLDDIGSLSTEGNFRNGKAALDIWDELMGEIAKVKQRKNNGNYTQEQAITLLKRPLRTVFNFLVERGSQASIMKNIIDGTGDLGIGMKKLGMQNRVQEFGEKEITSSDILSGEAGSDSFIEEIAKDFLSSSYTGKINNDENDDDQPEFTSTGLDTVVDNTKEAANQKLDDIAA